MVSPRWTSDAAAGCEPRLVIDMSTMMTHRTLVPTIEAYKQRNSQDRLERIRAEITAGTYITSDKIDAVVESLHRVLFKDGRDARRVG